MTLRVLVLDEGFMSGALTAIGLRDAGCDVEVQATVGGRSRCASRGIAWRLAPAIESSRFADHLARTVRERAIDVVYPVTEPLQVRLQGISSACVDGMWTNDVPVRGSGRVFRPVRDEYLALLDDKAALSAAVARDGGCVPAQVPLDAEAALPGAIAALGLPLVVKGVRGRGGSTTTICDDERACRAALASLRARAIPAFAQRFVDGPTVLVGGVFHDGAPIRLYAGEKTRQHPRRTGPAVEIRSVRDDAAIEAALRVFALVRFTGLGAVDLVRGADGVRFLELNPRPWGSMGAARAAGVDLFAPLVAIMRGEAPAADLRYRVGVTSRVLPLYLLSPDFRRHPLQLLRSIAEDLRSAQGEPWRPPRQAWHLLRRLQAVGRRGL